MQRYVAPEFQDLNTWLRRSNTWTIEHKEGLIGGARGAIEKAIKDHYAKQVPGTAATADTELPDHTKLPTA
jgi:hypothetical protein